MEQRARKVIAGFLVVVGGIVLALSSVGWWAERSFLSTGRFTSEANQILDQTEVQNALTQVVVRQLSRAAGTDLQLAEPFLASVVQQVVQSGVFRSVFDAAVSHAHELVVDRNSTNVVLDLASAYSQIQGTLEQVAPKLAAQLPGKQQLRVVLLKRQELTVVYDTIDRVKKAVDVLTIAGVLLLAVGVAVAPRRWRTLALGGFVIVGSSAVLLLLLVVGRSVLHSRVSDPAYADAARAVYQVLTSSLVLQSVALAAIAGVIALAARFTDHHGLAAWPQASRRTWRWIVAAVPVMLADDDTAVATPPAPRSLPGAVPSPGEVAIPGLAPGVVLAKLRLPEPRQQVRRQHVLRAFALLAVGLVALFDTDAVTTIAVAGFGVVALYFAFVEALAAWRAPKHAAPHL